MSVYLELQHLSKIFGHRAGDGLDAMHQGMTKSALLETSGHVLGVYDASLQISRGELFVIMGMSGSGKSTLLRMINRLVTPTSGKVLLDNVEVTAMAEHELVDLRRRRVSMVFQSFALMPHLNVIENVMFGLRNAGVDRQEARRRARDMLKRVGIEEVAEHYPAQLSGGMQQRVGLARAWVTESDLMLMDEAFSALDPLIRTDMQTALLELQQRDRRTIVFVSHDLTEAVRIADRIAVMAEGSIRQVGTAAEIIHNPADDYVRAFFRDVQAGKLLTAGDIADADLFATGAEPVAASSLLEDILPRAAASDVPFPVADEDGKIVGAIDRARLLQALAGRGSS